MGLPAAMLAGTTGRALASRSSSAGVEAGMAGAKGAEGASVAMAARAGAAAPRNSVAALVKRIF